MDRGAWLATVNGVTKSPTRLSFFHFTLLFSFLDNFIEVYFVYHSFSFEIYSFIVLVVFTDICKPSSQSNLNYLKKKSCTFYQPHLILTLPRETH